MNCWRILNKKCRKMHVQKHWRIQKHWRLVKTWRMLKTWRIQNIRRMLKTWRIQNIRRMLKTWRLEKYWRLQKCWRRRKSRRTCWRTALLFRLGRICNCSLLSGPADEHVLLLADVLNLVHVVSKWRMVLQCPAFMGGLSSRTVPAVCTSPPWSKWSNLWRRPNTWARLKFHCFQLNHSSLYLCL